MVNFRLIPLGIALARASNYVLASVLSRVCAWMTAHAQAGSRAGSCYLAATPTYQRQCVLPGYSQPAPTPPDPLVRVARPSRQLFGMHNTSSAVGSYTSDTSAPTSVLVAGHQLAGVALAFFSVPIAAFTSAAIWWPCLEWCPKNLAASVLKSRHLLIIAAK